MLTVASSQYSFWFDKQVYFPYSIAILVSYLKSNNELNNNLEFLKTAIHRSKVNEYVKENNPDVLLCSCYSWNWEITKYLALEIKKKNPNCIVIFGGPQTPRDCTNFFKDHSYVDAIVHNEGEVALQKLLLNIINGESFDDLKSVSTPSSLEWEPEELIKDLDDIPSPYTSNLVYDLIDAKDDSIKWIIMWETSRGCPFKCSYCAYGVSAYNTTRKFSVERLYKEIDWMATQNIEYVDCVDANFGMFKRDVDLIDYLVETKKRVGYPFTFRTCWSKKITPRVMYIAKELHKSGLLTAMGCSLQSLDKNTLSINNRKSVDIKQFNEIIDEFKNLGAQTYTEIIRGLPGETLQSFKNGLDKITYESNVDTTYIYNCLSIKNTTLNSEEFINKHQIVLQKSPMYFPHIIPFDDPFIEYDEIVVRSTTYTTEELLGMHIYSWYILVFQVLGIFNWIIKYLKNEYKISYQYIFDKFKKYSIQNKNTLFGGEYQKALDYLKKGYSGGGWFLRDETIGNINWPIDEASWIRISDYDKLFNEIKDFLNSFIIVDEILVDLIQFQLFCISNKTNTNEYVKKSFSYDWINYFLNKDLIKQLVNYSYKNKITKWKSNLDWNTQAIWFGRRKVNYKIRLQDINKNG